MPMHRRNKSPRDVGCQDTCAWFRTHRRRQRRRDRLSLLMRRIQRRRAKGKG